MLLFSGCILLFGIVLEILYGMMIVIVEFDGGVVMGGDWRVMMGSMIVNCEIEKVFGIDEYSCVGIVGSVGLVIELVKFF